MKSLNIIELFAGVGAPSIALKRLGHDVNIVSAIEYDKHAMKSYNAIHNTNFEINDITKMNEFYVGDIEIDLLHMSPPCTKFSVQGKGGGDKDDETWLMWKHSIAIIKTTRPKYVSFENVKNVAKTSILEWIMREMFYMGYQINYNEVLNSKNFQVPQNRERLYIVWVRNDTYNTLNDILFQSSHYLRVKSSRKKTCLSEFIDFNIPCDGASEWRIFEGENRVICVNEGSNQNNHFIIAKHFTLNPSHSNVKFDKKIIVGTLQEQKLGEHIDSYLPPKLTPLKFNSDAHFLSIYGISGTITANGNAGFKNKIMYYDMYDNLRYRNLTVYELGYLQGFSDREITTMIKASSIAQAKKQIGNSITINVLQAIYREIKFF